MYCIGLVKTTSYWVKQWLLLWKWCSRSYTLPVMKVGYLKKTITKRGKKTLFDSLYQTWKSSFICVMLVLPFVLCWFPYVTSDKAMAYSRQFSLLTTFVLWYTHSSFKTDCHLFGSLPFGDSLKWWQVCFFCVASRLLPYLCSTAVFCQS